MLLLAHGADVNATDETGMTALELAVRCAKDERVACMLAKAGAAVAARPHGRARSVLEVVQERPDTRLVRAESAAPLLPLPGVTRPCIIA